MPSHEPADRRLPEDAEEISPGRLSPPAHPWDATSEVLGRPTLESLIPSLRRVHECYEDGTEVTFLEGKAISIAPGERARQAADGSFVIETESETVAVADSLLRKCGQILPSEPYKCAIEESYWFDEPTLIPTAYDGVRFTPSLATGPYIRAYHLQFGAPHFLWPQPNGFDWCPKCRDWHIHPDSEAGIFSAPPFGSGYFLRSPEAPRLP